MARKRIPVGSHGEIGCSSSPDEKGRYRAWVTVREFDGSTRLMAAFGAKPKAALKALAAKLLEWQSGNTCLQSDPTIEALVQDWLAAKTISEGDAAGEISPQTRSQYAYYIRSYIVPDMGQLRVKEVRASLMQRFLLGLVQDGQGHTNARIVRSILKQAFDHAILNDVVSSNPVTAVKLPRKKALKPRGLTQEELVILRAAVRGWRSGPGQAGPSKSEHLEDLFEVMLGTGLRIGEALALKWSDVDLQAKRLRVHATLVELRPYRDGAGNYIQGGLRYQDHRKGSGEEYEVELPKFVAEVLLRRFVNDPALNPLDAVFVTRKGTWVTMSAIRRSFNAAKKAAGIEIEMQWSKPHTLRKTAVTQVARSVSREEASKQAGHADERVTLRHYIDPDTPIARNGEALQHLAPRREK